MAQALDDLPGYRRRIVITPSARKVRCELEDDYHCMSVVLDHADGVIIGVTPGMARAPWTTCPGAIKRLQETFTGVKLSDAQRRGEKSINCTHLHDMTLLAAAHAADDAPLTYDIVTSDPIDGRTETELRRNGAPVLHWTLANFEIEAPAEVAGLTLMSLGRWITTLAPEQQEQARVLRWGSMIAHGRAIPLDQQSDPSKYPGNCYTFQPENAAHARRIGEIRDFTAGHEIPLAPRR